MQVAKVGSLIVLSDSNQIWPFDFFPVGGAKLHVTYGHWLIRSERVRRGLVVPVYEEGGEQGVVYPGSRPRDTVAWGWQLGYALLYISGMSTFPNRG